MIIGGAVADLHLLLMVDRVVIAGNRSAVQSKVLLLRSADTKKFNMEDYVLLKRRHSFDGDNDNHNHNHNNRGSHKQLRKKQTIVSRRNGNNSAAETMSNLRFDDDDEQPTSINSCSSTTPQVERRDIPPATKKTQEQMAGRRHVYTFLQCCECQVFASYDKYFKARPQELKCSPPFRTAVAQFASSLYLELHNLAEDGEEEPYEAVPFHEMFDAFITKVFSAADALAQDIAVSGSLHFHLNDANKEEDER